MRYYGPNKATEFTKKQIGVIYAKAKKQEIKVEKFIMHRFYDLADYYGRDECGDIELTERRIMSILQCIFDGNIEEAQERIDSYTETYFALMSKKNQERADRSLVA